MTDKKVYRYLGLIDRRLQILTAGIYWKPEQEREMKKIEKEIAELRPLVEREEEKPETGSGKSPRPVRLTEKRLLDIREFCQYIGMGRTKASYFAKEKGFEVKIGSRVLYDRQKVDKWCDEQRG